MRRMLVFLICLHASAACLALPLTEDAGQPGPMARARDLLRRGDADGSRSMLEQVVKANPANLEACELLVQSCIDANSAALAGKALQQLARTLTARKDFAAGWRMAGDLLAAAVLGQFQPEETTQLLRQFVTTYTSDPGPLDDEERQKLAGLRAAASQDSFAADIRAPEAAQALQDLAGAFHTRSLKLDPRSPATCFSVARYNWALSDRAAEPDAARLQAALDAALEAAKLDPASAPAHALAGKACRLVALASPAAGDGAARRQQLLESALEHCRRAVELAPADGKLVREASGVYLLLGRVDDGVKYLEERAQAADSEDRKLTAVRAIGDLHAASGNTDDAKAARLAELEAFPDRIEPYWDLLLVCRERQEYEEAIDLMRRAADKFLDFLNARVMLGTMLADPKHAEEARTHLAKAMELYSKDLLRRRKAIWREDLLKIYPGARLDPDSSSENEAGSSYRVVVLPDYPDEQLTTIYLLHLALMSMADLAAGEEQYTRAGDIIYGRRGIYYELDDRLEPRLDAEGNRIPREPVNLAAEGLKQAGIYYFRDRERRRAIECLTEATRLMKGDFPEAQRLLINVYLYVLDIGATYEEKQRSAKQALLVSEQMRMNHQDDVPIRYRTGGLMVTVTERDRDEQETILRANVDQTTAYKALPLFDDILAGQPGNLSALLLKAWTQEHLKLHEAAVQTATLLLAMDPADSHVIDQEAVRPADEKDLLLYQTHARAVMGRACTGGLHDLQKAQELLEQAYKDIPGMVEVLDGLGWLYYTRATAEEDAAAKADLLDKANLYCKKAAFSKRPTPESLYHLAEITVARDSSPRSRKTAETYLHAATSLNYCYPGAENAIILLKKIREEPSAEPGDQPGTPAP